MLRPCSLYWSHESCAVAREPRTRLACAQMHDHSVTAAPECYLGSTVHRPIISIWFSLVCILLLLRAGQKPLGVGQAPLPQATPKRRRMPAAMHATRWRRHCKGSLPGATARYRYHLVTLWPKIQPPCILCHAGSNTRCALGARWLTSQRLWAAHCCGPPALLPAGAGRLLLKTMNAMNALHMDASERSHGMHVCPLLTPLVCTLPRSTASLKAASSLLAKKNGLCEDASPHAAHPAPHMHAHCGHYALKERCTPHTCSRRGVRLLLRFPRQSTPSG